jgi:hypothetical protein
MTVNEALAAMDGLDASFDGTPESRARIQHLYRTLMEAPQRFWDEFFASMDAMHQTRAEADLHNLTGQTVAVPNFAELHELLRARAMKRKGGDA